MSAATCIVAHPLSSRTSLIPTPQRDAKASPRVSRRKLILDRVVAGQSPEKIAEEFQLSPKKAEKLVGAALKAQDVRPATEFAKLQLARLERALSALSQKLVEGDSKAIDTYLRVLDRAQRSYDFLQRTGVVHRDMAAEARSAVKKVEHFLLTAKPISEVED